jgi:hypothetical protein
MSNVLLNNSILAIYGFVFESQAKFIVDNFGIIGFLFFGRIPVDSSYFSFHFDSILSRKPQNILF